MTGLNEKIDSDELSAFIASTLRAIASGIQAAGDTSIQSSAHYTSSFKIPESIAFDIAVTAGRSDTVGGGLKIQIASAFGAQLAKKSSTEDHTVSRIAFSVPWNGSDTRTGPLPVSTKAIV